MCGACLCATLVAAQDIQSPTLVTNIAQLRQLASQPQSSAHSIRLEGDVWWASAAQGRFVLHDASGAEALEMELPGTFPESGQRVQLEGISTVMRRGPAIRLGPKGPVVDNNGVHAMIQKSGPVYLPADHQPIRVEWFNGVEGIGLEVEYEGPGISRQHIPDTVLVRAPSPDATHLVGGLNFSCYDVAGEVLPDFTGLPALKSGVVANYNLDVLPRTEHVGVVFTGFIRIARPGLYTFHLKSDDGSRLFVGRPSLGLTVTGTGGFPKPHRITPGQILGGEETGQWVEVEGKVTLVRESSEGLRLELMAGAGHMSVEIGDQTGLSAVNLLNTRIRAIGFCQNVHTPDGQSVAGVLLVPGRRELVLQEASLDPGHKQGMETNAATPPLLTTARAVHQLKRDDARRAYPVRIRGVVTCVLPEHQAFTIQDATRGLYIVDFSASRPDMPRIGEFLEVEGTTDPGLFAPVVNARQVSSLGAGQPPEAVRPTWEQLINGSLDAQLVEVQGIVTAVESNTVTMLTRGGVVRSELRLTGLDAGTLAQFENALVRVRGCLFANWDYVTHQVKMGEVRIYAADIFVDEPPPDDLFSSPKKSAGELLLFDPQAGVFQRVKVAGQIVYARDPEYFMMDGARGLRFTTKQPTPLAIGDLVEVVGFPDLLASAAPVLREALARKTGHAPLPEPAILSAENLVRAEHDATLVRATGLLVGQRTTPAAHLLEMQDGVRTFAVRLPLTVAAPSLTIGSRLQLTGIYSGLGGNRATGQDLASFELLLNSAEGIRVLARPSWWTLKRLLFIVGALALVLAAAALWITQLHRQVEERTAELGAQIQERQRVEHQRAMEEERTRIAQDLHDELGSGITEMSMLAARTKSTTASDEKRGHYLDHVGSKARELVTALDEIVWAMNPRHDSLASLVSYFSLYADRFLGLAGIAWRLEGPAGSPDQVVDSRRRHQMFLAFKEALNNIVRHSGAKEVCIGIRCEHGHVRMSITDNGCGLPASVRTEDMDGVTNMRMRIEKLGGRFDISGEPGHGTTVRFDVPSIYKS